MNDKDKAAVIINFYFGPKIHMQDIYFKKTYKTETYMNMLDNPFKFPSHVYYHDSENCFALETENAFKFRVLRKQMNEEW